MGITLGALSLLWWAASILFAAWAGHKVLGPVNRVARLAARGLRFQLTDFAWLMTQLQIALAAIVAYVPSTMGEYIAGFLVFAALALSAMWLGAIVTMSQAGVTDGKRRAAFVLVLLPGTLLFIAVIIVALGSFPVTVAVLAGQAMQRTNGWGINATRTGFCYTVVFVATAFAWLFLHWLARWILIGASPVATEDRPSSNLDKPSGKPAVDTTEPDAANVALENGSPFAPPPSPSETDAE